MNSTTSALFSDSITVKEFCISESTLLPECTFTLAYALLLNTPLVMVKLSKSLGSPVTPETKPALSLTATLGARAFPVLL